ncbi:hypothetical protein T08_867 [Trichinella sp. T8]|nr:hypothetical protein T08_867 [Trichinella sp. T8]
MYIDVHVNTLPSMSTMIYSSAAQNPPGYQVPRLDMHQYGCIDGFLIKMHYEKKRLAQISSYVLSTTPSYHIHCQRHHQQTTLPNKVDCGRYTPDARCPILKFNYILIPFPYLVNNCIKLEQPQFGLWTTATLKFRHLSYEIYKVSEPKIN